MVLVSLAEDRAGEVRELHEARQRRMADAIAELSGPQQDSLLAGIRSLRSAPGANGPGRRNPVTAAAQTPAPPAQDATFAIDRRARFEILGAVMLALFLAALDQTIVGTAMPRVLTDLHGTSSTPGSSPSTC